MPTPHQSDGPNSARYWRMNELAGLRIVQRSPSQAVDPEELESINRNAQRQEELLAHEARVVARHTRFIANRAAA
ncbi:hypothetical protein [Ottowia sp.]|uniref:hypothetical protein n=1 Tax=Ottowia sp. TaxID=1898956 RepID=UPI0025D58A75|nr:hypothetical protein [Ottowia sp.]MBK6616504.1 hypothetical protein [Ottowia sp.]